MTKPANVLLVDDRPANLLALEAVLEPLGQTLQRASSGREAVELASRIDFAVVLMDVQMPGLDGFETTRRLRADERTRAVPVIFLTAIHSGAEYSARGYALGAVDYIAKPFDPEFLKAKVGAFVAWYQQREELRQKQAALDAALLAARAKDEFLAVVSHELRTPLGAIIGWAEMLKAEHSGTPAIARGLEHILRSAEAQSGLIEDLLDVSRMVLGRIEIARQLIDLREAVDAAIEAARPVALRRGLTLDASLPARAAHVIGDRARLQQVVGNLLSNAIRFSRAGGRVALELEAEGPSYELRVSDDGIGIDRDLLPHVFERFRQGHASTARSGGLGLGLAIARHLVEAHGGAIVAESAGRDRGACFTLRLPASAAAHEAACSADAGASADTGAAPADVR